MISVEEKGGIYIFKKNIFKENGLMGKKRDWVLSATLLCIILIMFLILIVYPVLFVLMVFIWILTSIIYGFYMKLNKDRTFRNLTTGEWDNLKDRNIIHYSNVLDNQKGNSIIHLPCHISSIVNFRLPEKFRKGGFVWFHLSDKNNEKEPIIQSFLNAHCFEGNPRKQKVIVKLNSIPYERVYIEKNTGFILVKGDLNVVGEILEIFEWYNKNIYIAFTIKSTLKQFTILFYSLFIKVRADFEEKQNNEKEETSIIK